MTIPLYLQPAFNELETVGETDVANAITRILAQAALLGWTTSGGNTVKSPVNGVGQQITLVFTRIAANNLQMAFTDSQGRTATRRAQTGGTYTERLYFSTFSFFWDPSNGEGLWASILEASPDLQGSHDQTFVWHGSRTTGDILDGNFVTGGSMKLDASSPRVYVPLTSGIVTLRANWAGTTPEFGGLGYSQSGSRLWHPCIYEGLSNATEHRLRGRSYQALLVANSEAPQSEFTVPLDEANSGLFKVTSYLPGGAFGFDMRIAVRKG